MLTRVRRGEDGAVAVMVAVSLVVLIGMLVLTVDLGRVWTVRRKLSTGSDAAALAAAQECAMGHGSSAANAAGVSVGKTNEEGTYTLTITSGCDTLTTTQPQFVTADSSQQVDLIFAGIFGIDTLPASARAVAEWGPTRGVSSPVPIYLQAPDIAPCIADPHPATPVDCSFVFDNDPVSDQFGWLNFPEGWNTQKCSSTGGSNDISSYIAPGTLPDGLRFDATIPDDPGYVMACGEPGEIASQVVTSLEERANNSDPFLTFPVTDFNTYPPVSLGGGKYAFPIVGYTKLKVLAAYKGRDVLNDPACAAKLGDQKVDASMFCLSLQWVGGQVVSGTPGSGPSYGLHSVRLVA